MRLLEDAGVNSITRAWLRDAGEPQKGVFKGFHPLGFRDLGIYGLGFLLKVSSFRGLGGFHHPFRGLGSRM